MATNYPAALDDATTLPTTIANSDPPNNPSHSGQHDNLNGAVRALETKVGTTTGDVGSAFYFPLDTLVPKDDTWHDVRGYVTGTALDRTAATDMTAKFQAAHDACNATFGGVVILPAGNFKVNTSASLSLSGTGVTVRGTGSVSTLLWDAHATRDTIAVTGLNVTLEHFAFRHSVTRTAGNDINGASASGLHIFDVDSTSPFGFLQIAGANHYIVDVNVSFAAATQSGSYGLYVSSSITNGFFNHIYVTGTDSTHTATSGYKIAAAGDGNFVKCDSVKTTNGILGAPSSGDAKYYKWVQCYFDQCLSYGADLSPTGAATVTDWWFDQCYFNFSGTDGVRFNGAAANSVDGIHFSYCQFDVNGTAGTGNGANHVANCRNITYVGCAGGQNQQDGLRLGANLDHVTSVGCTWGPHSTRTANLGYGVNSVAGTGDYQTIVHNDLSGNTTGAFFKGATGTHNVFWPNTGDIGHVTGLLDVQTSVGALSASNTTEQTIYTFTVPAGTMGANGLLRLKFWAIYFNNSGGTDTLRIKIKFGGTTLYDSTTAAIAAGAQTRDLIIDFDLFNVAATNLQRGNGECALGSAQNATTGVGDLATAAAIPPVPIRTGGAGALDTTADQALAITLTCTTSNANIGVALRKGTLELLRI